MNEILISHTQLFIVCAYIACVFFVQGFCILAAMYIGSKISQGKPLIEKQSAPMDFNDFLIPDIQEPEYPIEEPHISWKVKEPDYGEAEEK